MPLDVDHLRESIPEIMQSARRWLLWRAEPRPGADKPSKVPYYASGRRRMGKLDTPADLSLLATFEEAARAMHAAESRRPFTGLGFALGPDDTGLHWQGIDLDDVTERGLHHLVEDLPGYVEQSPSGNGWHAIGYGREFATLGSNTTGVEAYSRARFFTVTGDCAGLGQPVCLADFVAQVLAPIHARNIGSGGRNSALTSIAGGIRRKGANPAQVAAQLMEINARQCDPPLPTSEVRAIAASIGSYAPGGMAWEPAHDPHTHVANANRIRHHWRDRLLHVPGIGWHVWGPPWRHDEGAAQLVVQGLGKIIAAEAANMGTWVAQADDRDERARRQKSMDARFKWAGDSEYSGSIASSMRLAEPHLSCNAATLDADPFLLGLPSGVLDLRTGEVREHRQEDLITRVAGTDWVPGATAPRWEQFLNEIMGGDAELVEYLQRLAGYSLSGQRGDHLLPILWGRGANGKSTFIGTLQKMLGDYAGTASPDLLIAKAGSEHPTALADLQGRRLMVVSETGEGARLDEERAKWLTGGDVITARRMRQDFYQFAPTHLLMMQTNHRPRATGTDEGLWRRVRLIPFTITVPPERRDPRLPDTLRGELPGILAWAFEGWKKYQNDGLPVPAAVHAAGAEYRAASDIIGQFLADCCTEQDALFTVRASELYAAYCRWCDESGEKPRSQRNFGMALTDRGLERARYGDGYRWRGISLIGERSERSEPISRLIPREAPHKSDKPGFGANGSLRSPPPPRPKWADPDPKEAA